MTMHLARGLTTINTKKRKRKITNAKMAKWTEELRLHNKHMKRLGMKDHMMTIDEYIDYIHGEVKPKKKTHLLSGDQNMLLSHVNDLGLQFYISLAFIFHFFCFSKSTMTLTDLGLSAKYSKSTFQTV